MGSRSCANRSKMVSHTYNLPHPLDLAALTALAERMMTGREEQSPRCTVTAMRTAHGSGQ
jgi:hypothetical protein